MKITAIICSVLILFCKELGPEYQINTELFNYSTQSILNQQDSRIKNEELNYDEINEEVIFSFKTCEKSEFFTVSISKKNNYIVCRYSNEDSIELEYPISKKETWKKFEFAEYYRGGGEENQGINTNHLHFTNDDHRYIIFDDYSYAYNQRSVGILVLGKDSNTGYTIEGDIDSVTGDLISLNRKFPQLRKLRDWEQ